MKFQKIGLARENESPENPGGLEQRVALIPEDVKKLIDFGCAVSVEQGAGERVGFADSEYEAVGAQIVSYEDLYRDKDMVIKFKGPAIESIHAMGEKTTLFCMAHFHSFPDRAKLLEDKRINVVAMEEILESPKKISDEIILSKRAMQTAIDQSSIEAKNLDIKIYGFSSRIIGAIRRAGNRSPKTMRIYQQNTKLEGLGEINKETLFFYDSQVTPVTESFLQGLRESGAMLFDLTDFEKEKGTAAIAEYRKTHPPFEFGLRRIQSLHETGRAGARYGFKLLKEESPLGKSGEKAQFVVLGYGNVGMGAIHEAYEQGVPVIKVLGKRHTQKGVIENDLDTADLVVNGAEQPRELRGKNFLISREHAEKVLPKGGVVIDLVGGSETNRSPVENVIKCTFLTEPHFVEDQIYFSALWGWPMMGFMRETAIKYSGQIVDVLLGEEKLISGLSDLPAGVKRALVCGPF